MYLLDIHLQKSPWSQPCHNPASGFGMSASAPALELSSPGRECAIYISYDRSRTRLWTVLSISSPMVAYLLTFRPRRASARAYRGFCFLFFAPYLCILLPDREIFARVQSYSTDCFGGIRVWRDPLRFYAPPSIPYILLPFLLRFVFFSTYRRSLESSMGCLLCILPTWPLPDFIRTKPDVIRVTATKSSSKPALSRLSWPHLLTEGNAVRARRACLWQALPLAKCLAMTKRSVARLPATPNDRSFGLARMGDRPPSRGS